jgi:SAM-dependent methyltransferase
MHFNLVKIEPAGVNHTHFDDAILPIYYALLRLGYRVDTRVNDINRSCVNILFGSGPYTGVQDDALPANTIIFNLEQASTGSIWNSFRYRKHLRRFTVWDYSRRNVDFLRDRHGLKNVALVRLGYVPEMTRLNRDYPPEQDVLFYGTLDERRERMIEALRKAGLSVCVFKGYGRDRDYAIARSRCIVNVHHYVPATLEIVRLGYLWANRKAVVSERQDSTEVDPGLEESCRFRPYDELAAAVCEIARSKTARKLQEEAGFASFTRLRQEDFLEAVLGRRVYGRSGIRLPRTLHAGSGADFRPDCLNIDINPSKHPDLALDLSKPLDPAARYPTARFGDISLRPGSFSRITAFELLEHIRDLPTIMRNFLDLLCEGGELLLSVPYDLSLGAWQDPTHVRAFNENSWIYYSSWAGYLGWRDARFDLRERVFTLGDYGARMQGEGRTMDELLRLPRAVEGMRVTLRKRASTIAERAEYDFLTRTFYEGGVGEWAVRDE